MTKTRKEQFLDFFPELFFFQPLFQIVTLHLQFLGKISWLCMVYLSYTYIAMLSAIALAKEHLIHLSDFTLILYMSFSLSLFPLYTLII